MLLPQVNAERDQAPPRAGQLRQPGGQRRRSGIIETHAVDHRPRGRIPESSRPGIARLGVQRDGTDLDMTKAQGRRRRPGAAVFVEAGGEPDRVGEFQTPALDRPVEPGRQLVQPLQHRTQGTDLPEQGESMHAQFMRVLRRKPEERGFYHVLIEPAHGCALWQAPANFQGSRSRLELIFSRPSRRTTRLPVRPTFPNPTARRPVATAAADF